MKYLLNGKLDLKCLYFTCFLLKIKHQIVDKNIQGFFWRQKIILQEWNHSLCQVWNVSSLILCKLPILFSTVKLQLEHKFFQFIHRFKIEIFWVLFLTILTWKKFSALLNSVQKFYEFKVGVFWRFSYVKTIS